MFVDCEQYDFTRLLEDNWSVIRDEFCALPPASFVPWPEHHLYNFGWKAYGLVALAQEVGDGAERCPATASLLRQVPGLINAGFSILSAGTEINPHTGYTSAVYRFHLGLVTPPEAGIRVGTDSRNWEAGKLLGFDDMVEHETWNRSSEDRAVLLFDVLRPGHELEIPDNAREALKNYLQSQA